MKFKFHQLRLRGKTNLRVEKSGECFNFTIEVKLLIYFVFGEAFRIFETTFQLPSASKRLGISHLIHFSGDVTRLKVTQRLNSCSKL